MFHNNSIGCSYCMFVLCMCLLLLLLSGKIANSIKITLQPIINARPNTPLPCMSMQVHMCGYMIDSSNMDGGLHMHSCMIHSISCLSLLNCTIEHHSYGPFHSFQYHPILQWFMNHNNHSFPLNFKKPKAKAMVQSADVNIVWHFWWDYGKVCNIPVLLFLNTSGNRCHNICHYHSLEWCNIGEHIITT